MPSKIIKSFSAGSGIIANVNIQTHRDYQPSYSVSIARHIKKYGKTVESNIFLRDDLPKLEHVTRKAFDYILTQQATSIEETLNSHTSKLAREKQLNMSWSKS